MKKIFFNILWISLILTFVSCNSKETPENAANPFDIISDSDNDERNKIVVISDLHLGADLEYSETVKHIERLKQFLSEVRSSTTIKEMIINGDLYDDWYVPSRIDTYGSGSHADFIRKTVAANQGIFDLINGIITDGKIKVTYIPGNHDMGFTAEDSDFGMPGVNQARDEGIQYGIGRYYPEGYPQIAVEHGHRYDFFCNLVPNANETDFIYSPGYFFARVAANSFSDPTTPEEATSVPLVTLNDETNAEQKSKFTYYNLWKKVLETIIYVKDNFNEPIIKTNAGGYTQNYSINDILPHNSDDGSIQINLFNNLFTQSNWNARLQFNNVEVMTPINQAIVGSLATEFIDQQSNLQYFQNPNFSHVRIVLFGHTHQPKIYTYTNLEGKPCIYANSGTWVDEKTRDKNAAIDQDSINMTFLTLYPLKSNKNRMKVLLSQYVYGKHLILNSQDIEL